MSFSKLNMSSDPWTLYFSGHKISGNPAEEEAYSLWLQGTHQGFYWWPLSTVGLAE